MQRINQLLEQTSKELKKGSSASRTAAGRTEAVAAPERAGPGSATGSGKAAPDHVDAINQVFAEFEFAYHNQFHKAFPDPESLVIAKKYWLSNLEHYAPGQIVQAGKSLIRSQEYLPSIAVFLRACEQGRDLFGLPAPRAAYVEACRASSPKSEQQWSHAAVYHAGQASGWYLLANEPEAVAYPVFEYHYEILCRRVMAGESLVIDTPPAIAAKAEPSLDKAELHDRITKLKKELGL